MTSLKDPGWASRVQPCVRARLEAGLLPSERPSNSWAGPGHEKPCDACDGIIAREDIRWELDFGPAGVRRLHAGCLRVWEHELNGGQSSNGHP